METLRDLRSELLLSLLNDWFRSVNTAFLCATWLSSVGPRRLDDRRVLRVMGKRTSKVEPWPSPADETVIEPVYMVYIIIRARKDDKAILLTYLREDRRCPCISTALARYLHHAVRSQV